MHDQHQFPGTTDRGPSLAITYRSSHQLTAPTITAGHRLPSPGFTIIIYGSALQPSHTTVSLRLVASAVTFTDKSVHIQEYGNSLFLFYFNIKTKNEEHFHVFIQKISLVF